MLRKTENGTVADHYAAVQRAKGRPAPRGPSLVDAARPVWNAFIRLHNARQRGMAGPLPISYSEIMAYDQMSACGLSPWEVDAIRELDAVYLAAKAEELNGNTSVKERAQ